MADVKISQLPAGTANASAVVPATNAAGNLTEKITLGGIAGLAADLLTPASIGAAASSHGHAISDVTNLQTSLDGKAASSHSHAISDVTNLQTSLDGKVASNTTQAGGGTVVTNMVYLTQAQYDDMLLKDPNTIYFVQ